MEVLDASEAWRWYATLLKIGAFCAPPLVVWLYALLVPRAPSRQAFQYAIAGNVLVVAMLAGAAYGVPVLTLISAVTAAVLLVQAGRLALRASSSHGGEVGAAPTPRTG